MLEGDLPVWFPDVQGGVLERLVRVSSLVPADVELGFHFCEGHDEQAPRRARDMGRMVEIANALAAGLERPLNWVHMPLARDSVDAEFARPLRELRLQPQTELYLGVLYPEDAEEETRRRIAVAAGFASDFGLATPCGWGRLPSGRVGELIAAHLAFSRPIRDAAGDPGHSFAWDPEFERIPDEPWVDAPVDEFGLHYDTVENHGWYRNLDLTVEQLAGDLRPGDILIDYSGGTGILLDRLGLRIFDRQVGMVIVDSSPKFLRVALDRFRPD